jgi:hypothetical protein
MPTQEYSNDDKPETSANRSRAEFKVHSATSQNWDFGFESYSSYCLILYRQWSFGGAISRLKYDCYSINTKLNFAMEAIIII